MHVEGNTEKTSVWKSQFQNAKWNYMPKKNISNFTVFLLLYTHCTFEKCIHIVNLSVHSISQVSTHSTEDLFFLLLPISHSHQPSTQRSNLKLLYCKLQFLSISKGRDLAIEPDQVIILLYLHKELREICEFQVSNLTSNWNLFESSLGIEFCSIRTLPVCLRLLQWLTLWRKKIIFIYSLCMSKLMGERM